MAALPLYDPICSLLEKRFNLWNEEDKKEFLKSEKPKPYLDVTILTKAKGRTFVRTFKLSWYSKFDWLTASCYLKKLFCLPCLIISSRYGVWNFAGFCDFNNVNRALNKHGGTAEHLRCELSLKHLKHDLITIQDGSQEDSRLYIQKFNEKVQLNRRFMLLPIRATLFLAQQGLDFCGHWEDVSSNNCGNFKELLDSYLELSTLEIREHYKTIVPVFSDTSKTIQNQLINCISEYIDDQIENEIKQCDFFSIQVYDTTDICQKSQCCIIIRYVSSGVIKERFMGFYDIDADRSSDSLFQLLISCLEKYDFNTKLVGQCYDGAGHLNGLQEKIKEISPQAVFVHCLGHRLNLVLEQSCKSISNCRIFFSTLSGLPSFFHHSPKRTRVVDTVLEKRMPTTVNTKWTSNSEILNLVYLWTPLQEVFNEIITDQHSDETSIRESRGFLNEFEDFNFAVMVIIFSEIFSLTGLLFDELQKKPFDINYCISQISNTKILIESKRNKEDFKQIFEKCLSRATPMEDQTRGQIFEKYKMLYYEIIDIISMQISIRFDDLNKIKFVTLMDTSKFEQYSKTFPTDDFNSLKQCYADIFSDIQLQRLKSELQLIYSNETYRNTEPNRFIKMLSVNSDVFREAYKLFSLIVTIPFTSGNAEGGSSCLKRIKFYLRNSMGEERLSNMAKISIENELLQELICSQPFFEDIIDKFGVLKDTQIDLKFKKY